MEQLSGLDAAFVHQDSRRTPMHVTAVLVYDIGADDAGAIDKHGLQELVTHTLSKFPVFRRRLRRVPMDVDTPYWVDTAKTDFSHHLSDRNLGPELDWPTLQGELTAIHQRRLDLSKPLWEMCLLHGLNNLPGLPARCQALVIKIHHSTIDGISLAAIIDAMHRDTTPAEGQHVREGRAPDHWEVWARLNLNSISRQFKLAETVRNLVPGVLRARKTRKNLDDLPAVLTERAHFNDRVGMRRTLGVVVWPRDRLLAIKRAVRRVTLNDIALSIVSGALREYLTEHRHLPAKSLVAGVPINLRGAASEDYEGNRIATMMVGLATCESDPVERLRLVHRYAVSGKKRIDALGTGTVMDISDSVSPNILAGGIRAMAQASVMAMVPVPFHTMVSNVPGPMVPLHLGAAELVVPFGFGPVRDNMGLFHIVSSSASQVSLSFNACSSLLPDGEFYQQCLRNACSALYEQAAGARG